MTELHVFDIKHDKPTIEDVKKQQILISPKSINEDVKKQQILISPKSINEDNK